MEIKARILIVDDNCDFGENIKDILEGRDYFAECAVNGKEAIELAGNNKYDIVLIDIKLPDISGNEVVSEITEIATSTDFIYMTGHASINSAIEAVKQKHVVSYELKPLDLDHLLNVINQVVERKRIEKVLRLTQFTVDNNADATYWVKSDAKISYANKAACQALGYSYEELICMRVPDIDPDFPDESWSAHWQEIKGAGTLIFETNHKTKADLVFPVEIQATFLEYEGEEYICAFVRNITERKQMQEALLQSEKLKSIGTITAGIAHEFNNILAIISGNVQLLEGSRKDDEELTNALSTIKRATNDGAEISRRMLKFTKTAKDITGFVPFDINELINQAIDFTRPRWKNMAQAKGINYHMDTEGMKRVPSILCNPTELREVLVNIINNALDAMPDDGRITFRTWSEEDTVFISISDTGEGMPEDIRKNIFDPFFTTKVAVGTGLGMSTAYGIITRHGGNIEVESEVGKGSTFTLKFPSAAKAGSPKESPEPKQEIKTNSLRILVIDDEEAICNILEKFFSKKGHLVRTVDNGREAIILTKAADFDLVLCDMVMPDVYGYDVIKALNKLEKRPKIGIITGWSEKLKPIDDEGLKVDIIIRKPFDLSELSSHINELFV
ncbi:MAG: response regulator [Candidatus Scalindua sp.]